MTQLLIILYKTVEMYEWVLIARILLSWAPMLGLNVDFYKQPFKLINDLTEPAFRPFRGLLTFGMMDFSPILLFIGVGLIKQALAMAINSSAF